MDDLKDKRRDLDAFANASNDIRSSNAPAVLPMSGVAERVFGAQQVAVYRDESRILAKLAALGAAAGQDWFYRFPVKRKDGGQDWIEGASIKLANDLARIYGNCDIETRVVDFGDHWHIYARFTDFETGYSLTRPFQQRKSQGSMKTSNDRALDIALQIGVSKAIRNVVCNALQTYSDYAFENARNSLVDKIGKDIQRWREQIVSRLENIGIDPVRAERVIGRSAKDWTAPDIARIVAMGKAVADGMSTAEDTFPLAEGQTATATAAAENQNQEQGQEQQASSAAVAAETTSTAPGPSAEKTPPASEAPAQAASQVTSEQVAKEAGGTTAATEQPAKEGQGGEVMPATNAQYFAFCNAWRERISDPAELETRWKSEKKLRTACRIEQDTFDTLEKALREKIALVKKG